MFGGNTGGIGLGLSPGGYGGIGGSPAMGVMGGAMGLGGAAAAPPGVNASPYGGNLAIPPPSASPSAGPPPQKKSLLGSASPAGAHVAFPVRSLTPRSPWLTSRGGLTPRMKPRGKSASPSPGGGDYSGART